MKLKKANKFFFLDANALARLYFPDIGKKNIDYIYNFPNSQEITIEFALLEVYGVLCKCFNAGILTISDIRSVLTQIMTDCVNQKIILLNSSPYLIGRDAKRLLFLHATTPGMTFNSADALYLAACIDFAKIVNDPKKLIFVTSDKPLYNAAKTYNSFSTFHFWTCNLGNIYVSEFIPVKSHKDTSEVVHNCRSGEKIIIKPASAKKNFDTLTNAHCPVCNINVCPNTYPIAL